MALHKQNRRAYHPAVSIFSWMTFALATELVAPARLGLFIVAGLSLLSENGAFKKFLFLCSKARWLWIALILMYAWNVPGELVWPVAWSPTLEGLEAGLVRVARLLILIAALSRLSSELDFTQLAAGIYLIAKPLEWLGLDRRALAVRLSLALEQAQTTPEAGNWLEALRAPQAGSAGNGEMHLSIARTTGLDAGVLLIALAMLGLAVF